MGAEPYCFTGRPEGITYGRGVGNVRAILKDALRHLCVDVAKGVSRRIHHVPNFDIPQTVTGKGGGILKKAGRRRR